MSSQKDVTKKKILDAAFRLLTKQGFANTSMRDIAKEAGVALSLLTYYFLTKENLFTALAAGLVAHCFSEVEEKLNEGQNEKERMLLLSAYFEDKLRNDRDLMKILLDFSTQALWNRSFRFQVSYLFDKLSVLIRDEILSKQVREGSPILGKYSPDVISKIILGSLYGTAFQMLIGNKGEEEITEVFSLGNTMIDICRK